MPKVTKLRRERGRGRSVVVELDGAAWRTLPLEVVARSRLQVGDELDRERARIVRRELRRHEALAASSRALRHRDLSAHRLEERLERQAIAPVERAQTLETLMRAGVVDDERLARSRAAALAARGYGDAAIEFDLKRQGLPAEIVELVLAELEPERERAARVLASAGGGSRALRALARRGFGDDAIEAAAADVADDG